MEQRGPQRHRRRHGRGVLVRDIRAHPSNPRRRALHTGRAGGARLADGGAALPPHPPHDRRRLLGRLQPPPCDLSLDARRQGSRAGGGLTQR
eukprot:5521852-Prymnesium_polylepis.1